MVYISYNPKYKIRFRIVNDVSADIEYFVEECCGRLGYILWKTTVDLNFCFGPGTAKFVFHDDVQGVC